VTVASEPGKGSSLRCACRVAGHLGTVNLGRHRVPSHSARGSDSQRWRRPLSEPWPAVLRAVATAGMCDFVAEVAEEETAVGAS